LEFKLQLRQLLKTASDLYQRTLVVEKERQAFSYSYTQMESPHLKKLLKKDRQTSCHFQKLSIDAENSFVLLKSLLPNNLLNKTSRTASGS